MALITYANKITMNENAEIPAVNKGRAEDWNEIKNVVNENYNEFSEISDYIVEGSSDYHSGYIKYNSGAMIEWGEAKVTDAIQTAQGPMYRTANPQIVNFSEKFGVNYPLIFLTAQANLNLAYLSSFINNGIDGFQFFPVGLTTSSAATRYVKWLAIGRWK